MKPSTLKIAITYLLKVVVLLPVAAGISCASQPKSTKQSSVENIIVSKLGKNYSFTENKSKTFVLYEQKPESGHVAKNFKYLVIRKSDNRLMLSGSYQLGYVKWISDEEIEVLSPPSMLEQEESKFKKVFSVNQNQPNFQ